MTVDELRASLAEYPGDMPVFAAWEGVYAPIKQVKFNVEKFTHCLSEDSSDALVIDVEDYLVV